MTAVAYQQSAERVERVERFFFLCGMMIALYATSGSAFAQSDVELLSALEEPHAEGSPAPAQATTLYLWPVVDLRPLFEGSTPSLDTDEGSSREALERRLLGGLRAYTNLEVKGPEDALSYAQARRGYQRVLALARGFARRGVQSYREVELGQALAQLESALELFEQAQQHSVDPAEVAQLHLTLGLIAVEQSQVLPALLSFREALLLNPRLRVRVEFDGPQVAKIFEQARAQLMSLPIDELTRLAERARRPLRRDPQPHQLRAWYTPRGLSTTLSLWRGEHLELKRDQTRAGVQASAINALASRLWACLPLRRGRLSSIPRELRVDLMYHGLTFINSPVSFVLFQGIETSASLHTTRAISTYLGGSWHISGRDSREDLRADVSVYELYLGPQWRFGGASRDRVSGAISLSATLTHHTAVTVSREVGCKYFELSDPLPPQLCQPSRDITRFNPSWGLGPRLDALLNVPLARAFSLHVRLSAGTSVYQSEDRPFELPISAGLGVGYIFHLGDD